MGTYFLILQCMSTISTPASNSKDTYDLYRRIDLHCHTTMSDGKDTTEELVAKAVKAKLELVIITEHDLVNRDGKRLLQKHGIRSFDGVEISARDYTHKHSLHLPFYAEHISSRVDTALASIRMGRIGKVKAQCEKLEKNGFLISYMRLEDFALRNRMSPDCVTNYHLAGCLLSEPHNHERIKQICGRDVTDQGAFIRLFLKDFSKYRDIGYAPVSDYEMSIEDVVDHARKDHAVVSVAHPNFTFLPQGEIAGFEQRMPEYAKLGIQGIEVNSCANDAWITSIQATAARLNMILTFGSDSHGDADDQHQSLGNLHPIATAEPRLVEGAMDQLLAIILGKDIRTT